jgi:putative transcriptional regulator
MDNKFEIKSNSYYASIGKILISEPLMQDKYFKRSVILLIEHSKKEGSVGVILNKPLGVSFNQVI